jgi:hypothetical protein
MKPLVKFVAAALVAGAGLVATVEASSAMVLQAPSQPEAATAAQPVYWHRHYYHHHYYHHHHYWHHHRRHW